MFRPVIQRTAYRCRAYPDAEQQAVLNRTFGCIRVVWNRSLAARHERYRTKSLSGYSGGV
jgi:putative transposase